MHPTIPHKCFKFDFILFTAFTELSLRNRASVFYQEYSVHHVGKTMRRIEKWFPSFRVSISSTTLQNLGEIEQRAPAVGVYSVFLSAKLGFDGAVRSGKPRLKKYCVAAYKSILIMFTPWNCLLFQMY